VSKQSLHRKLFLARQEAQAVDKQGSNGEYDFARAEDVLAEAKPIFERWDLLVIPEVVEEELTFGKSGALAKVVMEFEVRDVAPRGWRFWQRRESLFVRWSGTGHDSPGDKALYKATTGAGKYFLSNLLGIPFGSDPEAGRSAATSPTPGEPPAEPDEGTDLLVVKDVRRELEAMGSPEGSLQRILNSCGIVGRETDALIPVTEEQAAAVGRELVRMRQDRAGEQVDVPPRRERPLPESDLPEPDWDGLGEGAEATRA
jgi:hypothetical protein